MTSEEKIRLIAQKLSLLSANIDRQKAEIDQIKDQINQLMPSVQSDSLASEIRQITDAVNKQQETYKIQEQNIRQVNPEPEIKEETKQQQQQPLKKETEEVSVKQTERIEIKSPVLGEKQPAKPANGFNLEQYLGGKLAGIIGIIALVIGIAMGVKYAIDNDLINPLTRVIFGFLSGGILLSIAFLLKKKYHLFSAIILGGAVSVLFFSSYAGNAFYDLYPRGVAFGIMFVITAFTVFAAHAYNYEIIAVIGLVGAYAIPPLLSDGSGKIAYMFTYMAIINAGILILSLSKNWVWVKYAAYGLTWLIAASWIIPKFQTPDLPMALAFITIFFLTFYIIFIAYKMVKKIPFEAMDIVTLLSNSFIYFGLGYFVLNHPATEKFLGLFCAANAAIHIAVAYIAYSRKVSDKNILYFILALVFTFITIAIPVQLEGKMVTLCWFAEMVALYFIGSRYTVLFFRQISYAVAVLGFFSLFHDWIFFYSKHWVGPESPDALVTPVFNKTFLTSVFSFVTLGVFVWLQKRSRQTETGIGTADVFAPVMKIAAPLMFFIVLYLGVFLEIVNYFHVWEISTAIKHGESELYYTTTDKSISFFAGLWLMIYNAVFMSVIFIVNKFTVKSRIVHWFFYTLSILSLVIMIPGGLTALGQLRQHFNLTDEDYFPSVFRTAWMINFRYVFMSFAGFVLSLVYITLRGQENKTTRNIFIWFMHLTILTLLSSELVNQFRLMHPEDAVLYDKIARRMGLTILWALYSLSLIVFGIARKLKMLRIMGFVLFGVALVKLLVNSFNMSGGYKIIVWISIGAILTLIGFLYQRYKTILFGDDEESK